MAENENCVSECVRVQSVPESNILSLEDACKNVPIINFSGVNAVQEIIKASKDFGFFVVTNHGVSEDVIAEAMKVVEEQFRMPLEDIYKETCASGFMYTGRRSYLWMDDDKDIPSHRLDESIQNRPQRFRATARAYSDKIAEFGVRIMEMISEGLGLEKGYLDGVTPFLSTHNYPACPDTVRQYLQFELGLITILYQGMVGGLQVLSDGKWIEIEPVPNSFVVNIGLKLQVISNGMLKTPEYRVVTNPHKDKTTIANCMDTSRFHSRTFKGIGQ